MILTLPYPVSNNRNARMVNGRMITSKSAKLYKTEVAWLAKQAKCKIHTGAVSINVSLHPRMNKDGSASKTRLDLDNIFKNLSDALNGVAWVDDSQVVRIYADIGQPKDGGGLTVIIEEFS